MPDLMYKYHGYVILGLGDQVTVHDPDRDAGDRRVHTTDSLAKAIHWIDWRNSVAPTMEMPIPEEKAK